MVRPLARVARREKWRLVLAVSRLVPLVFRLRVVRRLLPVAVMFQNGLMRT